MSIDEFPISWDELAYTMQFQLEGDLEDSFEQFLESSEKSEVEWYHENGSFRSTEPVEYDRRFRNNEQNQCYYNCQTECDNEFTYVEGFVIDDRIPYPIPHAWLEKDGRVVEITMPEKGDIYWGVEVPMVEVKEIMLNREVADPIVEAKVT